MTAINSDKAYLKWAAKKVVERKKRGLLCEVVGCSNLAEEMLTIPCPIDVSEKRGDLATNYPDLIEILIANPDDPKLNFVVFWVCKKHHDEDIWSRMNYDRPIDMRLRHGEYEVHHWKKGTNSQN
jgi:hypothetical protein